MGEGGEGLTKPTIFKGVAGKVDHFFQRGGLQFSRKRINYNLKFLMTKKAVRSKNILLCHN